MSQAKNKSGPPRPTLAQVDESWSAADWLRWLGLAVLCALAYYPALHGGVLWDDNANLTAPELQSLSGLGRIWFEAGATQTYYPLLHTAFWVEHRLWGDTVLGYHLLNIFLHLTAAGLLVRVLRRLAIPGAWLAAGIFALHPVCVESVAWMTEQKNTLSLVFYLLAVLAYLRFERARGDENLAAPTTESAVAWRHYAVATGLFLLAILSKSATVTLPPALLVLAWWQRRRISWRRDIVPLLPWFALAVVAGLWTSWVERKFIGAEGAPYGFDRLQACLLAGRVVWFYAGKLLWPADLSFIYPRWQVDASDPWLYAGVFGVLAVLAGLWLLRRRARGPLAGALFFAGTLFPVLGFFNIFFFSFSYVADHFQYVACLGLIVPVAAGLTAALAKIPPTLPRWTGRAAVAVLLGALGLASWNRAHVYRDNLTLYRDTLRINPACWMAAYNLGMELAAQGHTAEAIASYRNALRLRPDYADAHANLAMSLLTQPEGRNEAMAHLETALRLKPEHWQAHCNLGNILLSIPGRQAEAIPHYKEVLRLKPDFAEVRFNLALVLLNLPGRQAEAIPHFEAAVRLNPALWQAHYSLGHLLLLVPGRQDDAIRHLEAALRLKPDLAEARQVLEQLRR